MNKVFNKRNFYILIAIFIFGLFAYMTFCTPLAGDDWGYALNGTRYNPFEKAIEFYFTWSGRFFSELWGFLVAPRKMLWNILNPLMFTGIFLGIIKLINIKKQHILIPLAILACILSVDDHLRMETYTWIMGSTYILPLFLSIVYFCVAEDVFRNIKTRDLKLKLIISNICLFIIGLMMENIAGTMVGAIFILMIYSYFNNRKSLKYFIINFIISLSSFMIMRLSPGSANRLIRDNLEWANLNIFEKIAGAFPSFIEKTFLNNDYLILFLSLAFIILLLHNKKINKIFKYSSIVIELIAIVLAFSFAFPVLKSIYSGSNIIMMIFWPIYTVIAFINLFSCLKDYERDKAIFVLIVAGASSLAMLFSPIYGPRSSIYTVYYIIILIAIILNETDIAKYILLLLMSIIIFVITDRTIEYVQKYTAVRYAQSERLEIIQYYKDHPEDKEAWIPRFPIYTVHSADVEPGDTYHFEVFKEFYNLPQDADKITFFYKD